MLGDLRKIKSLSIVPAFLWLFTQLVMSGVFFSSTASADSIDFGFSDRILICTPSGIEYVSAASLGLETEVRSLQGSENSGVSLECEWCLHFGNLGPLHTSQYGLKLPAAIDGKKTFQTAQDSILRDTGGWFFRGRAPPSLNNNS